MTLQDIKKLKQQSGFPSVTILIPTQVNMPERQQNRIRVKNFIKEAANSLIEECGKDLALPIINALEELERTIDYTRTQHGLAFFANKDFAKVVNLSFEVPEKVVIDKKFSLNNIINALVKYPTYWVLSISQEPARLFIGTNDSLEEIIDSPELQKSMKGFPFQLNYDVTSDREKLAYGTGDKDNNYMTELDKNFMLDLDKLFHNYFEQDPMPIIILGTQKNRAYFEEVTKHKDWIAGQSEGDFTKSSVEDIKKISTDLIKKQRELEAEKEIKNFQEAIGKNKYETGIKEVFKAAMSGKIHLLLIEDDFIAPGAIVNNALPEEEQQIILYDDLATQGSFDLVHEVVAKTMDTEGTVIFVKPGSLKEYGKIAAILRY